MGGVILILFFLFVIALSVQAWYNVQTSLFGWFTRRDTKDDVNEYRKVVYQRPITVLLPGYHEEAVIGHTIEKLAQARYPKELLQILVILRHDDTATIDAANAAIDSLPSQNIKLLIYAGDVPGKPPQLNYGLRHAQGQLTTIIDAEDDVDPDLFTIANYVFETQKIDVLQMGVQLMDFDSSWYSIHNVLEYFFQFRSRMYYLASEKVVPLGGNTCFFKTAHLFSMRGWDELCLTEDAEIGLRLSQWGKNIGVHYEAAHVTREETPDSLSAFVKQRTRWNQGFLQTLERGNWLKLPTFKQRLLALYVLGLPFFQAAVFLLTPFFIWLAFTVKMPLLLSLASFIPFSLLALLLGIQMVGLHEFGREQHKKIKIRHYLILALTFLPFQYVLSFAALRAAKRYIAKNAAWEKTAHSGVHRTATAGAPS